MANSIEMASIDDQNPLISQTEKDEIEEGSKVDHSIDIADTNGQDPSGSQTNKSINKISDEKFKYLNNSSIKLCTIFKVNVWLRESNPDAYTPKMVSIGPYHNKKPQLHPMKKYKWLYLERFLRRRVGLNEESCISELEKLKEKAINCYEDVEDDSQFCQMLLLDGCFVVEFIRECSKMRPEGEDKIINSDVFIMRDLILLENQLPFFVLDTLHDMTKRDDESPLAKLACDIWLPFFGGLSESNNEIRGGDIKHLLHLKHAISCDKRPRRMVSSKAAKLSESLSVQAMHMVMPNATELSEAGVKFAKAIIKTSVFDSIKFENGLMKIPRFRVEDSTETILRNLIAYEQQTVDVKHKHFSNFAVVMDKLIESEKDVNLLCQGEIIENWLGDTKEVANLFNKIGNGVIIPDRDFYYEEVCKEVVKHYKETWNKLMAIFWRNYFSTPCLGASTVAAILLLVLTIIQTVLAIIDLIIK